MFGINDDNNQPAPAPAPPVQPAANPVNPISGNETLGPPQVSAGLPSIISGASNTPPPAPTIMKKSQPMAASPPAGDVMSAALPPHVAPPTAPTPAPTTALPTLPAGRTAMQGEHESELLGIKTEALQHLTPLVDKLDQAPAERFKTYLMMLQASDNPALVKQAFDAANAIPDEKAKAQALLDVVNEINYFTHPEKKVDDQPKSL